MTSVYPTSPATHIHIASLSSVGSVPSLGTRGRGRGRGFAYGAVRQPKTIGGLQQRPVNSWTQTDQTAAESCQHWIMDRPRRLCMCLPAFFFMCVICFCFVYIHYIFVSRSTQLLHSAVALCCHVFTPSYNTGISSSISLSDHGLCHWSLSLILDFWFLISDH